MRRVVLSLAVAVTVLVAGSLVAIAVYGRTATDAPATAAPAVSADPVSAEDSCYVEAMIFYRVSESQVAAELLSKKGIGEDTRAFASTKAQRAEAELTDLRAWYVSWLSARPTAPPVDGPCAGHGAEHTRMPGVPSPKRRQELADAEGPAAEQVFAGILRDQNSGMVAFIATVLEDTSNARVRASATAAREEAAADDAALRRLPSG